MVPIADELAANARELGVIVRGRLRGLLCHVVAPFDAHAQLNLATPRPAGDSRSVIRCYVELTCQCRLHEVDQFGTSPKWGIQVESNSCDWVKFTCHLQFFIELKYCIDIMNGL